MCTAGFERVCDSSSAGKLLFRRDPVSGTFRVNFEQAKVDFEIFLSQRDWGFISRGLFEDARPTIFIEPLPAS